MNSIPWVRCASGNVFSLLKSHIVGYDGVWYSSFWSERFRQNLVQHFLGARDLDSRRQRQPLAPRVQTQGNKKLDQIFQFRSKQRKKIIVNFPFQTHFTKIQNRKYKNTKNTNTSNIDIDLTCPHEGPLCLCAGLHLRKPHTATQNMTQ